MFNITIKGINWYDKNTQAGLESMLRHDKGYETGHYINDEFNFFEVDARVEKITLDRWKSFGFRIEEIKKKGGA